MTDIKELLFTLNKTSCHIPQASGEQIDHLYCLHRGLVHQALSSVGVLGSRSSRNINVVQATANSGVRCTILFFCGHVHAAGRLAKLSWLATSPTIFMSFLALKQLYTSRQYLAASVCISMCPTSPNGAGAVSSDSTDWWSMLASSRGLDKSNML